MASKTFCCCWKKKEDDSLESPLITDGPASRKIYFAVLYIPELDAIFNDFEASLNPFVENRISLENAEKAFKEAVRKIQDIGPKASFHEYIKALKTSLSEKGLMIKIAYGAVMLAGEITRITDAERKSKEAVEKILSTAEKLHDMLPTVNHAVENAIRRAECLDVKAIVKRECTGIKEGLKIAKKFKDNLKQLKKTPKMISDFCKEVENIVKELTRAFSAEIEPQTVSSQERRQSHESDGAAVRRRQPDAGAEDQQDIRGSKIEENEGGKDKQETDGNGKKEKDVKTKKEKFHKALSFEKLDIPDIDRVFSNFATTINPFVTSREKMQKAREKFEKVFLLVSEFDADKEFKAYLKELKRVAKAGDFRITINLGNHNTIVITSLVVSVPVPRPLQDVIDCLNAMTSCASQLLDLEPEIQRGVQEVLNEILNIKPESDIKRVLKLRELPKLPAKIKKFNSNRKTAQEAPDVIADFFKYIKQVISDIKEAFEEE